MNKPKQTERDVIFRLETFHKNRIVNKILKELGGIKKYNVSRLETLGDSRIFEIRVFSDKDEQKLITELKTAICDIIEDKFPLNYQFDFITRRLGWTNSFNVFLSNNKFCFECYTRVKEIRCDGSSVLPEANNQIKY